MDDIYPYITIFILLILSGMFSSSETAFFSLSKEKKEEYKSGLRKSIFGVKLLNRPNYLLVTLLFGNMLVNIFLSNLTEGIFNNAKFLADLSINARLIISIASATFILLIFGEALPKVIAMNIPHGVIKLFSPVIYFISIIIYPFKIGLYYITRFSRKVFYSDEDHDKITDDELSAIVNASFKEGAIDREEVVLIQNVIKFANYEVSSIMTPRTQMFAVDLNSSIDKFLYEAKKVGYSKVPVYEENIDNVKGIIYMRDLLSIIRGEEKKPENVKPFVKDVLYIPEAKPLLALLRDFKEKRIKAAVVIDEYGGTAGFVTLDDLIHRITGKFYEEDSKEEGRKVQKTRQGEYLCLGDASLEEIHRVTGIELLDDEQETIAGYLMSKMDKVPKESEKHVEGNLIFKVTKMQAYKIEQVIIKDKTLKKDKKIKKKKKDNPGK